MVLTRLSTGFPTGVFWRQSVFGAQKGLWIPVATRKTGAGLRGLRGIWDGVMPGPERLWRTERALDSRCDEKDGGGATWSAGNMGWANSGGRLDDGSHRVRLGRRPPRHSRRNGNPEPFWCADTFVATEKRQVRASRSPSVALAAGILLEHRSVPQGQNGLRIFAAKRTAGEGRSRIEVIRRLLGRRIRPSHWDAFGRRTASCH